MSDIISRLEALAPHSEDQAILEEAAHTIRGLRGEVESLDSQLTDALEMLES